MKRTVKQYLLFTFGISYLCFFGLIYAKLPLLELLKQPLYIALFILGCLGPFISSLIVYAINQSELGGLPGLWKQIKTIEKADGGLLLLSFLVLHYGLSYAVGAVGAYGDFFNFFKYLPLALLLFGSQEIGWRLLLQPGLAESRGFWKSTVATGLFVSLWFLPLLFVPQFVARPDFYVPFAAYVVGMGLLSTTVYLQSKCILYSIIFATFFYALFGVFIMKQANTIFASVMIDVVMAAAYNSRFFTGSKKKKA